MEAGKKSKDLAMQIVTSEKCHYRPTGKREQLSKEE
jgi:hypothetical protein